MSSASFQENPKPFLWKMLSIFGNIFWTFLWLLVAGLILLRLFVFQQVNVVGHSMDPNYADGQMLLIDKTRPSIARGQVVAAYANKETALHANYFTPYDATNTFFLKRVIGLPGESIEIIKSKVIIYNSQYPDGAILQEDYLSDSVIKDLETKKEFEYVAKVKIEENSYFLMGDNRSNSTDSRHRGTFPDYTIFGQEVLRYWPFNDGGVFELPVYTFKPISSSVREELNDLRSKVKITSSKSQ